MNRTKLNRIKKKIDAMRLRPGNIRAQELENLAAALGRERSKRGKEPTYISTLLPNSKPISIPNHPGALNKFVAGNILDSLEQDIFNLEEMQDL